MEWTSDVWEWMRDAWWGATWYDALQAIGTLTAVLVAVALGAVESARARRAVRERDDLLRQQTKDQHRASAALVSAWVETDIKPAADGTHYSQQAHVHLANESSEPVFNVYVVVRHEVARCEWLRRLEA